MSFKPNFDLFSEYKDNDEVPRMPYIAVFRYGEKTLVYMCDEHNANRSYDMIDWVFDQSSLPRPDVLLIEKENNYSGQVGTCNGNSLLYAAARAAQNDIPVVFADMNEIEMKTLLRLRRPDCEFSSNDLGRILTTPPMRQYGEDGVLNMELNRYGRDRFMIENIVAALDKYDTIYAIFGEGHFREQRFILIDMLGKPEYIDRIPNMRRDFGDLKIEPVKLIDFDMGDEK